ncbi:MAG: hypothetical protein KDK34_01960 [Leptospiraceae bacterium]|nr:hypothetical protein [Leptospiraceae bacterium]
MWFAQNSILLSSLIVMTTATACLESGMHCREHDAGCYPMDSWVLLSLLDNQRQIQQIQCPTDFIVVPHNTTVGTSGDFCAARFEMKDVAGKATSQSGGAPWVNIDRPTAISKCSALGSGYHLMTNAEAMTIARNLENNATNWNSANVGIGLINMGHTDNAPAAACDGLIGNVGASCAASAGAGWDIQKRTHTLSNGEIIWDFSGNVWEWIDWTVTTDKACPVAAFAEFTGCVTYTASMPETGFKPSHATFDSTYGIGQYYAGNNGVGGAALRGGDYSTGVTNAGIFALSLGQNGAAASMLYGFRCTLNP